MIFSSFNFIFMFLPLVWVVFMVLKNTSFPHHYVYAKLFLVLSSLFFYAYWKIEYLPILLSSICVNYFLALLIINPKKVCDTLSSLFSSLLSYLAFSSQKASKVLMGGGAKTT
ncbi:putative Alginate O-acetyltransferase AlgI [Helicobacter fennelliae]|uniref:Putative Alginate O-acetyltransferase AlgI n=1 Tax=Helicobacter fennelliae TaxID=215 RepID=A0A2X3DEU7_9HELI|nr:hypothetical protein [Helicobacter fennelliae]SQB98009.1 putative Alginate O-acetyltransferase AlgI [Helicobacter fennelliae]